MIIENCKFNVTIIIKFKKLQVTYTSNRYGYTTLYQFVPAVYKNSSRKLLVPVVADMPKKKNL